MTPFDLAILGVLLLSTLFAFLRGFVRESIALVSWIVGFAAAFAFAPVVGAWIPEIPGYPTLRYLIAFAAIVIVALVAGALIAMRFCSGVASTTFAVYFLSSSPKPRSPLYSWKRAFVSTLVSPARSLVSVS